MPDKIYAAAEALCRERALTAESPQREALQLYAELLPGFAKWDAMMREGDANMSYYMAAIVSACASMIAGGIRTTANDNRGLINAIGPAVTADLARLIQTECFKSESLEGRADGKMDS